MMWIDYVRVLSCHSSSLRSDLTNLTLSFSYIAQADMVRTPGDVFSFMQTNKIGERVALFWVAWAYVAEKALNYKLTDQIFQKGKYSIFFTILRLWKFS